MCLPAARGNVREGHLFSGNFQVGTVSCSSPCFCRKERKEHKTSKVKQIKKRNTQFFHCVSAFVFGDLFEVKTNTFDQKQAVLFQQ